MTGAYLRAQRNGHWANVEVEHLTDEELRDKFLHRPAEELVNWMAMLCAKIRQIEPVFDGLVKDGILVAVSDSEIQKENENVQRTSD
ncbi:MAG: hypothetical protein ABTQ25_03295 [Nitrosomonas ureae]